MLVCANRRFTNETYLNGAIAGGSPANAFRLRVHIRIDIRRVVVIKSTRNLELRNKTMTEGNGGRANDGKNNRVLHVDFSERVKRSASKECGF